MTRVALPLGRVGVEDEIKQAGILGPYRAHVGFHGTEGRIPFAVREPGLGPAGSIEAPRAPGAPVAVSPTVSGTAGGGKVHDDWPASRTGMASGVPARGANDCVLPSRGKTPAVDSLPTTRAKVLGGSSWTRSGGKLAWANGQPAPSNGRKNRYLAQYYVMERGLGQIPIPVRFRHPWGDSAGAKCSGARTG